MFVAVANMGWKTIDCLGKTNFPRCFSKVKGMQNLSNSDCLIAPFAFILVIQPQVMTLIVLAIWFV